MTYLDPVDVLRELSACPTAPFHEALVAARIRALCRTVSVQLTADRFGNLIAWYRGGPAKLRPVVFNAHMDHPALEVAGTSPLTGRLLGGLRNSPQYFTRRVPIRFVHQGAPTAGHITGLAPGQQWMVRLEAERPVPAESFAVFDTGPFRQDGSLLYQPAADDLAGCAAAIAMLSRCIQDRVPANIGAVFTRAEEVGLIGAMLVARQRLLPPDSVIVSLEASRALPGAEIGGGPVIRVGDRVRAFHPQGERLLLRARELLAAQKPEAAVQRQLMNRGTCEATAYAMAGYVTTGVAFPLGNYHNGGPDHTIAPEYIHQDDLRTGADLLVAAAWASAETAGEDPLQVQLEQLADEAAARLESSATAEASARA